MAWEYYEFIAVAPDAEWDTIRRAGALKRRELEIAKDSAGKAYLNEILQVLRDAQARADYDLLQQHGDKFNQLINDAREAQNLEEWPRAIRLFRSALDIVPDHPLLLNQLGVCLADNGSFREAEKIFADLVKRFPDTATYWATYGSICLDLSMRMLGPVQQIPDHYDLRLTGIQSAKRLPALNKIVEFSHITFESAKILVKSVPQLLRSFVEKEQLADIERNLRASGIMFKTVPSQGRTMHCPLCWYIIYLPSNYDERKATCPFCHGDFTLYKGDRDEFTRRARTYLRHAIEFDPTNTTHYTEIARSYFDTEEYEQALLWTEKAIMADNQEDYENINSLLELCRIYAVMGNQPAIDEVVRRIQQVTSTESPDTITHLISLISSVAFIEGLAQRFTVAGVLTRIALLFAPDDPELQGLQQRADILSLAQQEHAKLHQDLLIIDPVKNIVQFYVFEASAQLLPSDTVNHLEASFETISNFPWNVIRASVKQLKAKYPASYQIAEHFFSTALGNNS